jgi:hypothetical protein
MDHPGRRFSEFLDEIFGDNHICLLALKHPNV